MPDELRVYCNNCRHQTRHEVYREYEEIKSDEEIIIWQIVGCAGCGDVAFYKEHQELDTHQWEITKEFVFPPRQGKAIKHFIDAPANVDQLYRDTIDAFNTASFLLCAGGLRAIVEGICADKGVSDGLVHKANGQTTRESSLQGKIEGLAERRLLLPHQANTLHQHRFLGNDALHYLTTPEREDLSRAIDIIENVMASLYQIEHDAVEIDAARRQRRSQP